MKSQYYYLALSLLSILMMGCSNDSAMDTPKSTRMVPVGIRQVSVSGSAAVTRASTTITDGQIGVFRTTANSYPAQNNVPYSYNADGGWSATVTENAILVDHRNATLMAYYPYQEDADGSKVTLTSQVYAANQDLCYGTSTGTINNATPDVGAFTDMAHAYSRITLSIQRHATAYVGDCKVTAVNIKSNNSLVSSCKFDISTGTASDNSSTSGGWTYSLKDVTLSAGDTSTAYDMLVPPQNLPGDMVLTLTIDGSALSATIPVGLFSGNQLKAGSQYTIKLTIMKAEILLSSSGITVGEWGDVEVQETGAPF